MHQIFRTDYCNLLTAGQSLTVCTAPEMSAGEVHRPGKKLDIPPKSGRIVSHIPHYLGLLNLNRFNP